MKNIKNKILLITDDELTQISIERFMQKKQIPLVICHNWLDVISTIMNDTISTLICSHRINHQPTTEYTVFIKKLFPAIKVIFYYDPDDALIANEIKYCQEIDEKITSPLNINELLASLNSKTEKTYQLLNNEAVIVTNLQHHIICKNGNYANHYKNKSFPSEEQQKSIITILQNKNSYDNNIILSENQATAWLSASVLFDEKKNINAYIFYLQDIKEPMQNENIIFQSEHDPLTGLGNQYYLQTQVNLLIEEAEMQSMQFTLIIVEYQYQQDNMSDAIIRELSDILRPLNDEGLIIARTSEHQFSIIMPDIAGNTVKKEIENIIHDIFPVKINIDGEEIILQYAYGMSFFPMDGNTYQQLRQLANKDCLGEDNVR